MTRKTLTFALLALMAITTHAQHFDWVKSYTGTDRQNRIDNYIVGSVTDSDGNVYILGQCAFNATFEGVSISPIQYSNRNSIVIAKISPSGDMVWHKTVATKGSNGACAIRMNGDTSLICMLGLSLADTIYFLDTLYTDARSEIMPSDSLDSRNGTVFVTLSLDGELQEFHLLQTVYVDYAGHQITTDKITGNAVDSSTVSPHGFSDCTFVVDNNGNIIVARKAWDFVDILHKEDNQFVRYSIENGLLSGIQIWVDGHCRSTIFPQNQPKNWNIMLAKFAPHFNNLKNFHYLFADEQGENMIWPVQSMAVDSHNNIYLTATGSVATSFEPATATLSQTSQVYERINNVNSFLLKCNNNLIPLYLKQLSTQESDETVYTGELYFTSLAFGDNERTIFLSGYTQGGQNHPILTNDNDTLDFFRKAFFMCFDTESGQLTSYGNTKSSIYSGMPVEATEWHHQICIGNNRVFVPLAFKGKIIGGTDTSQVGTGMMSGGVYIWDTLGNDIGFISIGTESDKTQPGYIVSMYDSILYLSGHLISSSANFGGLHLSTNGNSTAYIAKYTDTAFMTPYVHTDDPGEVNITLVEGGNAFVAYPNPFRQSVKIRVESGALKVENGVATAWLTDIMGRREQVRLIPSGERKTESGERVYTLDLSGRPQATYLLTLTTVDGKQHTVRLLKQSDIFGQ